MIRQPLELPNGMVLRNRIVKSAMSEALGDELNNPTEGHIKLFERWSKGGAALLITGNTQVDRWHLEHAGNFVLDDRSDMDRARRLASAARSAGTIRIKVWWLAPPKPKARPKAAIGRGPKKSEGVRQ